MSKLARLAQMGPSEMAGRLGQALRSNVGGLVAGFRGPREMGDDRFLKSAVIWDAGMERTGGLLAGFRNRSASSPFPGLREPSETMASIAKGFPEETERILERAEGVTQGAIRLLGRELTWDSMVDWHLEPVCGLRTPLLFWTKVDHLDPTVAGEYKVLWELNRHQYLLCLGQAYLLSGDERFAETLRSHLTSWMDENPPSWGINWSSSLEVSYRVIAWIWSLHLIRDSEILDEEFFLRCLKFLFLQGRHIEQNLSTYFSPNTHLTGEALGLLYLGVFFPELRTAERWQVLAARILQKEVELQLRADGTHFEQASAYHAYTVDIFVHGQILLESVGRCFSRESQQKLGRAHEYLQSLVRPDGRIPLLGDDDGGRLLPLVPRGAADFPDTLSVSARILDVGGAEAGFHPPTPESRFLIDAPDGGTSQEIVPPPYLSRAYPEGGTFIMRDGWGKASNYLLVSCGPHGALSGGHAHADALSVEASVRGVPFIVDPGTFTYRKDSERRNTFRSTNAHNSVVVDGLPYAVPGGPFSWRTTLDGRQECWVENDKLAFFSGSIHGQDQGEGGVRHQRSILFRKSRFVVIWDRVEGSGALNCTLRYHLGLGITAKTMADGVSCFRKDDRLCELKLFASADCEPELFGSVVSGGYGEIEETTGVAWTHSGEVALDLVTVFDLDSGKTKMGRKAVGDDSICLDFEREEDLETIALTQTGLELTADGHQLFHFSTERRQW